MSERSETGAWPPATSTYESHPRIGPGYCEQYAAELRARMAWQTALTTPAPGNPKHIAWAAGKAQRVFDLLISRDTGPITITPLSEATWQIDATAEWWRVHVIERHDCELAVMVGRGINRDETWRVHRTAPGDLPCPTILNGDWQHDEAAMASIRAWAEKYQGAGDEAAQEQAVAIDREAKLHKWTDHAIVRVGNLVGSPHKYMVRGDAVIPWGWGGEMDPAAMMDAACALEIPITPWELV